MFRLIFSPLLIQLQQTSILNMRNARNITENTPTPPAKQQQSISMQEYQWIKNLANQFHEQVSKPLQIRQILIKNQEQQRCLIHSISYSIYCTICRKALCASCMYNTSQHRKHRVIPIESASDQLKEDIRTFQSKIVKFCKVAEGLIDSNGQTLMRIERQYNPLTARVKQFYENLRVFLKKKQKQHLEILRDIKDSATFQISQYNLELGKISHIVIDKLNYSLRQNQKTNIPIASRVMLQTLAQASSFINQSYFDGDKFKFPTEVEKVSTLEGQIIMRVNNLFKTFQTPLSSPRSQQAKNNKNRSLGKGVSFAQTRKKLQQSPVLDSSFKRKKVSMSNMARISQMNKF